MVSFGSLTPGLAAAINGSFQFLISPKKDTGIGSPREFEFLRHAGKVVSQHHSPGRHRHHDHAVRNLGNIVILQGGVTGAEVHLVFILDIAAEESPNALAAPHAIVGDNRLGMGLLVGGKPLFVERGRKCGACSLQKDAAGRDLGFGLPRALRRTGKEIPQESQCRQGQQEATELHEKPASRSHNSSPSSVARVATWKAPPDATLPARGHKEEGCEKGFNEPLENLRR